MVAALNNIFAGVKGFLEVIMCRSRNYCLETVELKSFWETTAHGKTALRYIRVERG
jgi:hypothetical protein